ncbi:hypothetical protein DV738_g4784, partial [Chaetothyriales sp. CBS 135597]
MSWKLTKKLKETHLAPLTSGFSRSTSTSTIKPEDGAGTAGAATAPAASAPTPPSQERVSTDLSLTQSNISTAPSTNGIAASEAMANPPVQTTKPGILIVTLHEGRGFSLPQQYQQAFNNYYASSGSNVSGSIRPNSSYAAGGLSGSYAQSGRPVSSHASINAAPTIHGRYNSKYLPYALLDFDKLQVFVDGVSGSPENPLWAGDNTSFKFDVSRVCELSVQIYLRNPAARPGVGRSEDIFLGGARVTPRFEEARAFVPDPKKSKKENEKAEAAFHQHEKQAGQLGAEWLDIQFGTGAIKIGVNYVENRQGSLKIDDFELLKVVGRGSFGKVMQVMKKDTGRIYALKTIRKAHIISRSEVAHTLAERSVLAQINNPFITPLKKILQEPLHFPGPEIVPAAAKDLLSRLLDRNPERRLGANGAAEIKAHHFFANIDWRKLLQRKYEPSFKPSVVDARDTANFDKEFTAEVPKDSYVEGPVLSQTMQQQFAGWSYNRPVAGLGDAGGSVKDPSFDNI